MNIKFNLIPNAAVSIFKENIISSLTVQQKRVLAIALAALGCLAICYAIIRTYCFKAQSLSDQNPQDPLENQMPNGMQMTQQQLYLKAIQLDPSCARAYVNLGVTLPPHGSIQLLDGTDMTKQQLYRKAIQLDPTLAQGGNAVV